LVLISSIEEAWLWLLGSERVLERAGRWVIASGMYSFDELLCFGSLYGAILDIVVSSCKRWFHHIFKDGLG